MNAAMVWRPALLLAGLAGTGLLLGLLPAQDITSLVPGQARTPYGIVTFLALGTAFAAVGLPRQVVAYAGGYLFGLDSGGALALLAQVLACAADLFWARAVARDWARRRIGSRLDRIDRFLAANPFTATVMLRLLPVGNNLALNLLAGVSSVPAGRFIAGSCVGYLPQTLIFALVGSGAHVEGSAQLGLGVALFAASAALGGVLLRRFRAALGAAPLNAGDADVRHGATGRR